MKYLMMFILSCLAVGLLSQERLSAEEEKQAVSDIRTKYKIIRDGISSGYSKTTYEFSGDASEGGELEAYYDGEELRFIIESSFGETGKSITEYYVWGNKVFFIFQQDFFYNCPIYVFEEFDPQKTKVEENRYYFKESRLIRWLDKTKRKVEVSSEEFINKNTFLNKEIRHVMESIQEIDE